MKTLIAAVFAISSMGAMAAKPVVATYNVDTASTKVEWVGKKVAGDHKGFIAAKSGNLVVSGDQITGGKIVIDMNSITNTDLTDAEWNGKLVGHLKHADFFDTAKFPEAVLTIKNSKKSAKGLDITGDLTIKGVTKPITFTATEVKSSVEGYTAKANITVDRSKYGLTYNAGKGDASLIKSLGDKMIYDEFTLNVELAAKK